MKNIIVFFTLFLNLTLSAKINIITSSQDLKSIAEFIGGEEVLVEAFAPGNYDLHTIEPRPSMVYKLKKADIIVRVGLDLDMWMDSLINAAKNEKVFYGKDGYIDASAGITLLQKPHGKVDASMGDIHIFGNPHYWLDPENGKIIAKNIKEGLIKIKPEKKEYFENNYLVFSKKIDTKMNEWRQRLLVLPNKKVITYHNSWVYFARAFDFDIVANIEPKPGIPPNANHIKYLLEIIKTENVRIILVDNFYPLKVPQEIAKRTSAKVVIIPSSVSGEKNLSDYFLLFDSIISKILSAIVD